MSEDKRGRESNSEGGREVKVEEVCVLRSDGDRGEGEYGKTKTVDQKLKHVSKQ